MEWKLARSEKGIYACSTYLTKADFDLEITYEESRNSLK